MIGNKFEQSIISIFQENISETLSINELSKRLNKAYPYVNKKVNFFIKEDIIRKMIIGKSYQCYLNISSEKTRIYMAINELNKREGFIKQAKTELKESSLKEHYPKAESILLYKQTIYIIDDHNEYKSGKINGYATVILTNSQAKETFLSNLDIIHNHTILFNAENYLQILAELQTKILSSSIAKRLLENE